MSLDSTQIGEDAHEQGLFVTAIVDNQMFGVSVDRIQDVFTPRDLTTVSLASREVAGILNLRGRIVTAIDTRAMLGLTPSEVTDQTMAIGIEHDGESYGLIIDSVGDVVEIDRNRIEPNPRNLDVRWQSISQGIYRLEKQLVVVLDVDRVFEFERVKDVA